MTGWKGVRWQSEGTGEEEMALESPNLYTTATITT